jgi:hypothetical protein
MNSDELLGGARWPNNLELTCQDDEEWYNPLSWLDKDLSTPDRTYVSMSGDSINLQRRQCRKHPFRTRGLSQGHWQLSIGH